METDRESFTCPGATRVIARDDCGRVDPAGEEGTSETSDKICPPTARCRSVASFVHAASGVPRTWTDLLVARRPARPVGNGFGQSSGTEIALRYARTVPGKELAYSGGCNTARHIAESEEQRRVRCDRYCIECRACAQCGVAPNRTAQPRCSELVERLLAHAIARQIEFTRFAIPECEANMPPRLQRRLDAPALDARQQRFGIGLPAPMQRAALVAQSSAPATSGCRFRRCS